MKKYFVLLLLSACFFNSHAQESVIELFYNVNNIQHSALCVLNGNYGKCHVLTSMGDCWFDIYGSSNGSNVTLTMSNPSAYGWIPGVCVITSNGSIIEFQGYRFGLGVNVIYEHDWNIKKAQYGFRIDDIIFDGDKPVVVQGASCHHSGCHCSAYKGYITPAGTYKGKCSNTDGWGHTCNHSPEEHGLNK